MHGQRVAITRMSFRSYPHEAMIKQVLTFAAMLMLLSQPLQSQAQDASKARALSATLKTTQVSVSGAEVVCESNRAGTYPCSNVNLMAFLSVTDLTSALNTGSFETNDIWGWTDEETGIEYALVGMDNGTMFIDLGSPETPSIVGFLPTKTGSSSWRDIKVYEDHAFIVADGAGSHGIQILDLTTLRNTTAPVTLQETAHYDGIGSAHNIVINEATGFAYAVGSNSGGNTCGGALHMVNIQDPQNPVFAGCFADPNTGFAGTGYTHDAQCVVYSGPDAEHQGKEICIGSNETHISIADVSDKANPIALSKGTYPRADYIHQGWFSEDQRYFFQDDEGDETSSGSETRTIIWDLEDLDDPVFLGDFFSGVQAIDHNMYVRGNFLYQANYTSGLRIWDISDPVNPQFVAYFDTFPGSDAGRFAGAWSNYPYFESGLVIVSSIAEGLFVLNPTMDGNNATAIEEAEIPRSLMVSPPFPNPAPDNVAVDVTSRSGGQVAINIVDATGRVVKAFNTTALTPDAATRIELDTGDLSSGTYILVVRSQEGVQAHPLTILK